MAKKPTYEELEQRVKELQREVARCRRAEKEALAGKEKYRSTIENAVWGVFQTTPEGRFLSANQALANILGYETPDDLMTSISNIGNQLYVKPAQRDEMLRRMAKQDMILAFETQVYRKDKSIIWLSLSQRAVKDPNGRLLYVEGFVEDATERKRLEEQLRKSEETSLALLNASTDRLLHLDANGTILALNQTAAKAFKKSADDLIGLNAFELFPADVAALKMRYHNEVVRSGKPVQYEDIREGRWLDTVVQPVFDMQRKVVGQAVFSRDITEFKQTEKELKKHRQNLELLVEQRTAELVEINEALKRENTEREAAEEALRESEEQYRSLIENLPIGLYRNTPGTQGRFIMANPAIARMFGYETVDEFLQTPVAELYWNPADRQVFSEKLKAQGYLVSEELKLKNQNNSTPFWGAVTVNVVRDESGEIRYFDGLFEDISDRKRAEEALEFEKRRFETLLEYAPFGIVMIGKDNTWQYVNPKFKEMFGYDLSDSSANGSNGSKT
jgi:PAS domain S-box-containing protein